MLEFDPRQRLKPLDALSHKFFKKMNDESTNTSGPAAAILNPVTSMTSHGLVMQSSSQVDPRSQPLIACGVPSQGANVGVALQLPAELTSKTAAVYASNAPNPQQSPATQPAMGQQISSLSSTNNPPTSLIQQQLQPRVPANVASLPAVISVAAPPSGNSAVAATASLGTPSNSSSAIESQPLFDFNIQVSVFAMSSLYHLHCRFWLFENWLQ